MPEPDGGSVPRRADGVVQAEVDGDLVLMSPKDFSYFGAEGAGRPVWDLIDGHRTFGEIVSVLEARYEANPGAIRAETAEFLGALVAAGLASFG